jgi:phosphatidylinositol alpha-1,6-mannosyltransferase
MAARILALVSDGYGVRGGIARYNQDLFEALAEGRNEILIVPRSGDANGLALPSGVRQAPAAFGRLRFAVRSLLAGWRNRPFDIVFCGHVFMAPIARAVANLLGARLWLQGHGIDVWMARRASVRRAIEAADLVTTVSRATRRSLLGWADLAPHRARVLPDTIRDMFAAGPPPTDLRTHLGLGPGPILLTVARLRLSERYKGHEKVFAVLPDLRRKFPTLIHLVVGDGDDRQRLEMRARELTGDTGAVRFLGHVPDEELPALYRLADLFVMPSTQEGFGIVYLEAAACGLRVVGGMGGGTADAVPGGATGTLVDPEDSRSLVDAIVAMLALGRIDPALVESYRRRYFTAAAQRLLARMLGRQRRVRGEA